MTNVDIRLGKTRSPEDMWLTVIADGKVQAHCITNNLYCVQRDTGINCSAFLQGINICNFHDISRIVTEDDSIVCNESDNGVYIYMRMIE